jgi:phenylacetate-CoA ligase
MNRDLVYHLVREAPATLGAVRLRREPLEQLRRRRLAATLRAAMRSPLQQERLRAVGADDAAIAADCDGVLAALPPLAKDTLRAAGTAALRDGQAAASWYSSSSSGSTGEPFTMHFDPRGWAILKHLVKARSRFACGVRPLDRVAILDAIPVQAEGTLLAERAGRVRRISIFRTANDVARMLDEFRPQAVYGLPSALLEAGTSRRRSARGVRVFTGGELLPPGVRAALTDLYGGPVHDCYGTSETKEIAWECAAGGTHVNADVLQVEALDGADRPVPSGTEGALVVTLLVNDAMPLLRYRTGDRGCLLPASCICGVALPLLGLMTGRESDVLEVAGGRRLSPYALTTALERVGGLQRYQVTQLAPGRLRVRALAASGVDHSAARGRMLDLLAAEVGGAVTIEVEFVERFTIPVGRKFRVVEPLAS